MELKKDLHRGGPWTSPSVSPAASLVFRLILTSAGFGLLPKLWVYHPSLHFMLPLYHCPTSVLDLAVNIFSVHSPWQGRRREQYQPWWLACRHLLTHLPPGAPAPVPHLPCWLRCTHLLCKDNSLWLWGTSQGGHISHGLGPHQHHGLTLGSPSHGRGG